MLIALLCVGVAAIIASTVFAWSQASKGLVSFLVTLGMVLVAGSVWNMTYHETNLPEHPYRLASRDTLYVVPKGGFHGLMITVVPDSTGEHYLVTKLFEGQHVLPPVVVQK